VREEAAGSKAAGSKAAGSKAARQQGSKAAGRRAEGQKGTDWLSFPAAILPFCLLPPSSSLSACCLLPLTDSNSY